MATEADLPQGWVRSFRPEATFEADNEAGGFRGSVTYRGPYSSLKAFLTAVGGVPEIVGGITRIVPLEYPDDVAPNSVTLFATRITSVARGHDQESSYDKADVRIDFRSFVYDQSSGLPYTTFNITEGGRTLTAAPGAFLFSGGTIRPAGDQSFQASGFQLQLTQHRLQTLDYLRWFNSSNTVNNAPFLGLPAGHVLYRSPTSSGQTTVGGVPSYDLTHILDVSVAKWNYEVNPTSGVLTEMFLADGTTRRYAPNDFAALFGGA